MSSSKTVLSSFNPHAVHPFTAGASSSSTHHQTPSARTPKPSPHTSRVHSAPNVSTSKSTVSESAPLASSLPSQTTNSFPAVLSPQPRPASKLPASSPPQPIFTPFKLERSSPELRDILAKKKNASVWPVKASNGTQGADRDRVGSKTGKL